jgi:hypothetical protein
MSQNTSNHLDKDSHAEKMQLPSVEAEIRRIELLFNHRALHPWLEVPVEHKSNKVRNQ